MILFAAKNLPNLAKKRISRHRRSSVFICLKLSLSFYLLAFLFAQVNYAQVQLSETDIIDTINAYRSENPSERVKTFQAKMPGVIIDKNLRADVMRKLPVEIQKLRINDPVLIEKFRGIVLPVLRLYGREDVYEIIVFKHSTPVMFSDTGLILVVSTGMIQRASSDAELLGYTAHEVAHEFFAGYSVYSKHVLKLVIENGKEVALDRKLSQALAIVELQCDVFAAASVAYLNANPISFIEGMEKIGRDFPTHGWGQHPPDAVRRRVVEAVVPQKYMQSPAEISEKLRALKTYIQKSSDSKKTDDNQRENK